MRIVRALGGGLLALVATLPAWSAPAGVDGTVVRVVDGDTIHVRVGARVEKANSGSAPLYAATATAVSSPTCGSAT